MKAKFLAAKAKRFQQSARILTGDNRISVDMIDNMRSAPACLDIVTRKMMINQAKPPTDDEAERLIYDRALLYHECGHGKYTLDVTNVREQLMKTSNNAEEFLRVSNILEDGRIEWLICKNWSGAKAYLNTLIARCFKEARATEGNLGGLMFYARYFRFFDEEQKAFWKPVLPLINRAVRAFNCTSCMRLAAEIVNTLYPKGATPNEPDPQPGEGQEGGEKGEPGEGESGESEKGESDEGDSESEGGEDEGGEPGHESEESAEEGGDSAQDGAGSGEEDHQPLIRPRDVKAAHYEAIEKLRESAEQEVAELNAEALNPEKETQLFASHEEEREAQCLGEILRSIQAEKTRSLFQPARRSGRIDGRRIAGIVSGDSFLARREESKGKINVSLLVDRSGSMNGGRITTATACARIVNGAIQSAGIDSVIATFGEHGDNVEVVPNAPLNDWHIGGGTPTDEAMRCALEWHKKESASRDSGLMLIITDGEPNSPAGCIKAYEEARAINCKVIVVLISVWPVFGLEKWTDAQVDVADLAKLSDEVGRVVIDTTR